MKNSFGCSITVTLFGESHGAMIGAVVDGLAPGIKIKTEYIDKKLGQRRPSGGISTSRVEPDKYEIVSGVYNGYTTGTPLTLLIPNTNTRSSDYCELAERPRPSHADYTAGVKYGGFQDPRGGGHFSGRITAALVAVGAIFSSALLEKGIRIGTHISSLGGIVDAPFDSFAEEIDALSEKLFPVISDDRGAAMAEVIKDAAAVGDSVGGVLETAIVGVPAGVGEPWFDTVESQLSHIVFSVPGIKGVEFGAGFPIANMRGSEANDPLRVVDGRIVTASNNSGGICGGITNGMPIIMRCAVKPTPSIFKEQDTVDLTKMENATLTVKGRHDPAIIHRARAVVDAVCAIAVADMLTVRFGTDYLSSGESK